MGGGGGGVGGGRVARRWRVRRLRRRLLWQSDLVDSCVEVSNSCVCFHSKHIIAQNNACLFKYYFYFIRNVSVKVILLPALKKV